MKILHITVAKSWRGNEQQLLDYFIELNKLNELYIVTKTALLKKNTLKINKDPEKIPIIIHINY